VSLALLDHLERQKEETNRLLEKSRAKQNEMIAIMPLSYLSTNTPSTPTSLSVHAYPSSSSLSYSNSSYRSKI
jgi:hypothetical protein